MDPQKNPAFLRKAGLAVWALFTLILLFCVLLLASELIKSGKSPLDIAQAEQAATAEQQGPATESQLQNTPIFVITSDGAMLTPEMRRMPIGDFTVDNCRAAISELKKPTQGGNTLPVLPASAECNALYLMPGGELVVDFSSSLQSGVPKSTDGESLMVYGVVNTLTQASLAGPKGGPVRTVRFLIDGAVPRDTFPAHLDLSNPVAPDPQWNQKVEVAR